MSVTRHVDLSTAKRSAAALREDIAAHMKVCNTCYRYKPDAARYCPQGYDLAKRLACAKDDIARLSGPDKGGQLSLL